MTPFDAALAHCFAYEWREWNRKRKMGGERYKEIMEGCTHSHEGYLQMNRKAVCVSIWCVCVCVCVGVCCLFSQYVLWVYVICINRGHYEMLVNKNADCCCSLLFWPKTTQSLSFYVLQMVLSNQTHSTAVEFCVVYFHKPAMIIFMIK